MILLERSFYARDTRTVARELLGKALVHRLPEGTVSGRIVETEAYFGDGDPASHASRGRTPRNSIMFGQPGYAYVYLNYGMHCLLNVVTEEKGTPGAVLIRALEPLEGIDLMFRRRPVKVLRELTSGPAKLTQAMGIKLSCNGADLTGKELFICASGQKRSFLIKLSKRIGISVAENALLRYYIEGNEFVSRR
ncbi:MAG: DNA-3-methyladenine glycosylase [Actinomycetota bacterium]|nr:DNA-3-methyladenine glycosylase [Actinomycetota bacterium]